MKYWKRISILATIAALVVSVLALQPASADSLDERISGNFIDTALDLGPVDDDGVAMPDGVTASAWSGQASGNGSPSYEGVLEIAFAASPNPACEGAASLDVVAYSMVRRYANGDLRVSTLVDGFGCFSPPQFGGDGTGSVTVNAEFDGGTGAYADATGTYTATFDLRLLEPDPTGGIAHGTFTGETTGTS